MWLAYQSQIRKGTDGGGEHLDDRRVLRRTEPNLFCFFRRHSAVSKKPYDNSLAENRSVGWTRCNSGTNGRHEFHQKKIVCAMRRIIDLAARRSAPGAESGSWTGE